MTARTAQIRLVHRSASNVAGHYRDDPRMTGDGGTADGALIARRGHHDHAFPDGLIERFFQGLFPFGGRLRKGEAQVDDASTGVDAFADRRCKLLRRHTHHVFASRGPFGKNGAKEERQLGQMAGAGGLRFAERIPATKVPCRHAVLLAGAHAVLLLPGISRRCSPARSGCWVTKGPSMSPIFTSELPLVRSINAVNLTRPKGSIRSCPGCSASNWVLKNEGSAPDFLFRGW